MAFGNKTIHFKIQNAIELYEQQQVNKKTGQNQIQPPSNFTGHFFDRAKEHHFHEHIINNEIFLQQFFFQIGWMIDCYIENDEIIPNSF